MYDLTFDPEKYEIKTCELGNRSITYRAFEHIVYCANPASKIQTLNIYVKTRTVWVVYDGRYRTLFPGR